MRFIALLILWLSTVGLVFAQADSSDFQVRVFGGEDVEAPSTPTLLSVTPIAPTQIDLEWSTSTDNYAVRGYVVLRGSSTIATTTQTSYSDTGLSASTTYNYAVQAFDYSFNYSSTSNSLATRTLDFPLPPPEEEPGEPAQGTVARVVVQNFSIDVGVSTSSFTMDTPWPTKFTLRWGRTASYELGFLQNVQYNTEHSILLTNLEPGTRYEYELVGENSFGVEGVVRSGQFTTLEPQEPNVPANVGRFLAFANGGDVELSWQLPPDDDVAYVRIVRSHLDFPANPQDGAIAYQGLRTNFTDQSILFQYSPVYYTAFVYDSEGNVSSGAIVLVYAEFDGTGTSFPADDVLQLHPPAPISEATSTINTERMTVDMKVPQLSEITIEQGDRIVTFLDSDIAISVSSPFIISIPESAVAGNLKTIVGTILDPTDNRQGFSFLLRINKDGTAYEAEIAPTEVEGRSAIAVDIYDYEAAIIAKYQAPVRFVKEGSRLIGDERQTPTADYSLLIPYLLYSLLPLLLILILFLVYRRRKRG